MPARRVGTEVVIEAEDTVDFGAGKVQGLCNAWHRLRGDEAERVLDSVQKRQQRPGPLLMQGDSAVDSPLMRAGKRPGSPHRLSAVVHPSLLFSAPSSRHMQLCAYVRYHRRLGLTKLAACPRAFNMN